MFYGPGAGKLPTASAVVADIIDIIANQDKATKPILWEAAAVSDMADFADYTCRRLFLLKDGVSLPSALEKAELRRIDGTVGALTAAMTETEASALAESVKDMLLSVYRVLD